MARGKLTANNKRIWEWKEDLGRRQYNREGGRRKDEEGKRVGRKEKVKREEDTREGGWGGRKRREWRE